MFHLFLYFSIHLSLPLPLSPSLLSFSLCPEYEKHVFERYMYIAHSVSKFSNARFVVCSFLPFSLIQSMLKTYGRVSFCQTLVQRPLFSWRRACLLENWMEPSIILNIHKYPPTYMIQNPLQHRMQGLNWAAYNTENKSPHTTPFIIDQFLLHVYVIWNKANIRHRYNKRNTHIGFISIVSARKKKQAGRWIHSPALTCITSFK